MDVKAIVKKMADRCKEDANFKQLVENDFGEALKSCGVDSPGQFVQALKDDGMLTDKDMTDVSGGTGYPSGLASFDDVANTLSLDELLGYYYPQRKYGM